MVVSFQVSPDPWPSAPPSLALLTAVIDDAQLEGIPLFFLGDYQLASLQRSFSFAIVTAW